MASACTFRVWRAQERRTVGFAPVKREPWGPLLMDPRRDWVAGIEPKVTPAENGGLMTPPNGSARRLRNGRYLPSYTLSSINPSSMKASC